MGPRLKQAQLSLTGTATIYADSNTPKTSGRTLKPKNITQELSNLRESIKGS
jgi:hypothetical protein